MRENKRTGWEEYQVLNKNKHCYVDVDLVHIKQKYERVIMSNDFFACGS